VDDRGQAGGRFHGLQLWVNLGSKDKWLDPRYQDLKPDAVALLSSEDGGALVRLIAGDLGDVHGPGSTHSPMSMIHATIAPGARLVLPWPCDFNALVYVLSGNALVGVEQRPLEAGQIAVHGSGDLLQVDAAAQQDRSGHSLELLVLGGRPIREPVAWMGPFVMNTKAEIAQAVDDFNAGKLGQIPPQYGGPDADLEPDTDSPLD
jgi:redox-sensitive bicupin YhaK (pirin superfamily)